MSKILQSTIRGQVTLPKNWRDQFETHYYTVEVKGAELVIRPLQQKKTLKDEIESSWQEYKNGKVITSKKIMKKYGL